jgi:putative hemolysin
VDLTAGRYRLFFARSQDDLMAVQRLRFRVFNEELGEGLASSWQTGLDDDGLDQRLHHIVIAEVRSGKVVGSYRLQTASMADAFGGLYSAGEFDLAGVPEAVLRDGVEIGRACVDAEHRNGRVLHLLWRGLAAYLTWNRKRWLFGCCSVPGRDPAMGPFLHQRLMRAGYCEPEERVRPRAGMSCPPEAGFAPDGAPCIPPLFQSYLTLGARVLGPPALDEAFGTIDFFVVLHVEALDSRIRNMYFRDLPAPPTDEALTA